MAEKKRRGPSIWEWVTVIVIVGVLAAILFPIFAAGRECANCGPTCQSKEKQLGLAFLQYTQDYDNRWPGLPDHWAGQIYPYVKSTGVYECPQDTIHSTANAYVCSYAMNVNLNGRNTGVLDDASLTALLVDSSGTSISFLGDDPQAVQSASSAPEQVSPFTDGTTPDTAWGGVRLGATTPVLYPPRHNGGDNFAACDGHVKWLKPDKVSSGLDNPSASGSQDDVYAAGTKGLGRLYRMTFSEK